MTVHNPALVERVAKALFAWDTEEHPAPKPTWDDTTEAHRDVWRSGSLAALAVIPEPATVGGAIHARAFIEWLASMDDPEDTDGLEARRRVTLTDIINRGRLALIADGTPAPSTVGAVEALRYAQRMALTERARGRADDERSWLDMCALLAASAKGDGK